MTLPYLSKHEGAEGSNWAINGKLLDSSPSLDSLLGQSRSEMMSFLEENQSSNDCDLSTVTPVDEHHEIWASGVTYLRSRDARMSESASADIYDRVYDADRPEIFFKSLGWRAVSDKDFIRVREDSKWNVPEPELVLVLNSEGEIVGYTAGNDVSSREIEGANPLYLPQAKSYDGSCSIGPGIVLCTADELTDLEISLRIYRGEQLVFEGSTRTSKMKRSLVELATYLFLELSFPKGVFLMTGTGIIPSDDFNLLANDLVAIKVGDLELRNTVA